MSDLISLVAHWIESRELTSNTKRLYELEVTRLDAWLSQQRRPLSDLTLQDIQSYLTTLERDPADNLAPFHVRRKKALGPRSREQTRRILHAFFEWAARHRHIHHSPFWDALDTDALTRPLPLPPIVVPPLSDSMKQLLSRMPEQPYSLADLRVATIAHLAFWLGASRSEIAALKVEDFIERKASAALRLPTSHGVAVEKPVPPQTRHLIRRYLDLRSRLRPSQTDPTPLVGSLRSGGPVSPAAIRQVLANWQVDEGPSQSKSSGAMSPRRLRQSFESIANRLSIQERVIATHFRTAKLQSAIDEGPVSYHPNRLYAEVTKEMG